MPKLSKIQNAELTETIEVDFGGGEILTLTVYPNRFTSKRQLLLQQLDDEDDDYFEEFAHLYFAPFKEWDLTDDKGAPLPFDATTVDLLSVPTMRKLGEAIGEALNPPQRRSKRSRGR